MSRKANPTLIGAFVFGAIILATIAVLVLAGRQWFQVRRQHIMYFDEVAQGLQVGAPVVFLGVKVGTVKQIQLGLDDESRCLLVPVTVELAPHTVKSSAGEQIDLQDRDTIRQLVDRGMRARLKVQSLLTGQLYVDLAFYPDKPARFISDDPKISEIPTIPTTVQEFSAMLQDFPTGEFLDDLAAISASIHTLLSSETLTTIPDRLDATLTHLESLTARLDSAGGPLLATAQTDLHELRKATDAVQAAMNKVGRAADQVEKLADEDSRIYDSITRAGTELAAASEALQLLTDEQSPTIQRMNLSLQEISRAARALRRLAESLEQQPEAVLRGKRSEEER
ncbi:MAG TPA: MCE family protein [Desulfobacteraceae bacterium]|nr:MCE family protein [Desulfobacteraceae bacterium]